MDQFTPTTPPKAGAKMFILVIVLGVVILLVAVVWWFTSRDTNDSVNTNVNTNTTIVGDAATISIGSFKTMAQQASCAQTKNELYTIDNKMVFWLRQGNCPDNGYAYTLYARNPQEQLCVQKDSIAGPDTSCVDDDYAALFNTMTSNLTDPELGIGASHQVEKVVF